VAAEQCPAPVDAQLPGQQHREHRDRAAEHRIHRPQHAGELDLAESKAPPGRDRVRRDHGDHVAGDDA